MKTALGLPLLALLSTPAIADIPVPHRFEIVCSTQTSPPYAAATLRYTTTEGKLLTFGSVQPARSGEALWASVYVDGLYLRFDWDGPGDTNPDRYRFSIVIRPDSSPFYDFNIADENGRAQPREYLRCSAPVEVPIE